MVETIAEFAARAGLSPQRARALARSGKISARRVGRSWSVTSSERIVPSRRPLSLASRGDLITYLNTRSFSHVVGHAKSRLVDRVRSLRDAENPAHLLREYFQGAEPEGRGGAAIVRAAQSGKDLFVKEVLGDMTFTENASTPEAVAHKIHTARLLCGLSLDDAAQRTGMDVMAYRRLERRGEAPRGNLTAVQALRALGAPIPSRIHARTTGGVV